MMQQKTRAILVSSIAFAGIASILCGTYAWYQNPTTTPKKEPDTNIEQNNNNSNTENELSLKNITITEGDTLSEDISYYLNTKLTEEKLTLISLNTSNVDTTKAGTYNYTLTYNGKTYTGQITVKAKEVVTPPIEETPKLSLTTKTITIHVDEALSYDIATYINETLDENIASSLKLDLSNVVINKVGSYTYTITYNDQVFTGTINVIEKVVEPTTPPEPETPTTPEEGNTDEPKAPDE